MPVVYGQVNPPASPSIADGQNTALLQGKQGDLIASELHGKFYTSNYRSRTFLGATVAAGVTVPISSTTAPTFTLYNPIGSGVLVELIDIDLAILNATTVVSGINLAFASGLIVAPTGATALAPVPANLGSSGVAQAKLYSALTLAAAATTNFYPLFSISAASGALPNFHYDFDGKILLQPGSLVYLVGTAAQTSASSIGIKWSEWPL